jgi:hypothetical protein
MCNSIDRKRNQVKNGESKEIGPFGAVYGGKVNRAGSGKTLAVAGVLGLALLVSGCKSAPDLTAANAQTLIQAKYDQDPAVGAAINVSDLGLRQGLSAKYWTLTKVYPNKYWADYKLTDDGKKAVTLSGGGDVFQWRPDSADDKNYSIIMTSVATNHLKARDLKDPQDDVGGTKSVIFTEAVSLDGLPAPLQDIAHNPGNRLSNKRTATFALDSGAWKLSSIS